MPDQNVLRGAAAAAHPVITDDGVALATVERGSRAAERTVVFLHGVCLSRASWAAQTDYLESRFGDSVRIISFDHRGHGQSESAPTRTYRVERLAQDLAQILTACAVQGSVTLVGHSMGGMVALAYLTGPGASHQCGFSVDGLVLCASAAGRLTQSGIGRLLALPGLDRACTALGRVPGAGACGVALSVVLRRLGKFGWPTYQAAAAMAANALAGTPVTTAVGFLPSLHRLDLYSALGAVHARTVVLSGGADLLTPAEHSYELAARIQGAHHLHIPAAGHMLPQQVPARVNAAIVEALQGFSAPSPVGVLAS